MATGGDSIPYVGASSTAPPTGTLSKDGWKAQWVEEVEAKQPRSPSVLNIPISLLSFFLCPLLGILAVIFAFEARTAYKDEHYLESEALSERSRGTAYYAIALGLGLGLGMGILLGLGNRFNWF